MGKAQHESDLLSIQIMSDAYHPCRNNSQTFSMQVPYRKSSNHKSQRNSPHHKDGEDLVIDMLTFNMFFLYNREEEF